MSHPHDSPASEAATLGPVDAPRPGAHERPGGRVGPYRLVKLIGEGGFGSVFMAEQEKPVARTVALKIIKLGMDTAQVVARFEQERQALAIMDHPSIAKVFDAGTTDVGRPYFVMELCSGVPIGEYCDRENLSVDQRLALLAQVCMAVQHAHTKGIIHRDIKPSNVLVTSQDGRPLAKVIDFGIAKATQSKLTEQTLFTEHRQLIGTPEYMSPEQAAGSADIDTRTDVYSLGVLLYELLTGSTPFSGRELRSAAFGELQRIIRDVEPPRPSTRLSQSTATIATVAAARRTEPRKLGAIVRGELDWIVMKALEKDRARRYDSPSGLAADIGRYLAREAIVAAPPGRGYRLRKFIRRHRGLVTAGALVAGALVLGVIGTGTGLVAARREGAIARENERLAVSAAARAEAAERDATSRLAEAESTVKFLDDMLGAADPSTEGKDVTVRAVLDKAAPEIGRGFADRPAVAARLHGTVGRTYVGLGMYEAARVHVREALEILRRERGPESEDACRAANDLGLFLIKAGQSDEAESVLKKAIADHERIFGRTHAITLQSLDHLALLYDSQSRPAEALPLVQEVLDARMRSPGPDHADTLSSMNTLATAYADLSRYDDAERIYQQVIAAYTRLSGPDHPLSLAVRSNYAWMLYQAGTQAESADPALAHARLEQARTLGEAVLEARRRVFGEEHQETLVSINNLGTVYRKLGMTDRADELGREEIEVSIRSLGEEHPDTIVAIANHGHSLMDAKRFEEALPSLERAVRLSRKALPPDNPGTAYALAWTGDCLRSLGRFSEGVPFLTEAIAIMVKARGDDHDTTHQMSRSLANLYDAWEKADPGKGHAAQAAAWRAKGGLPAPKP